MTTLPRERISTRRLVFIGLAVCVGLAGVVSLWASGNPDGLEFVAERLGFIDSAGEHGAADSPLAGYGTTGVDDPFLSGGLAGLIGVAVVAVISFGLMHLLGRRGPRNGN